MASWCRDGEQYQCAAARGGAGEVAPGVGEFGAEKAQRAVVVARLGGDVQGVRSVSAPNVHVAEAAVRRIVSIGMPTGRPGLRTSPNPGTCPRVLDTLNPRNVLGEAR